MFDYFETEYLDYDRNNCFKDKNFKNESCSKCMQTVCEKSQSLYRNSANDMVSAAVIKRLQPATVYPVLNWISWEEKEKPTKKISSSGTFQYIY